jgi:hypothetical protein
MMKQWNIILLLVTGIFLGLILGCSSSPIAGDVTETGNARVMGIIVSADGGVDSLVEVRLIPEAFNPSAGEPLADSFIDTTDSYGMYAFTFSGRGIYNIQARHLESGKRLLRRGIVVDHDTVEDLRDTLRVPGAIRIILPHFINTGMRGYVFIPGTDIYKRIDAAAVFLDSVPPGAMPALYYTDSIDDVLLKDSMTVASRDTMVVARVLYIIRDDTGNVALCNAKIRDKLDCEG